MTTLLVLAALTVFGLALGAGWYRGGRSAPEPVWVAHSGYLSSLPAVRRALAARRQRLILGAIASIVVLTSGAFLAGIPSHEAPQSQRVTSRDVIFCLDVSGSMLPLDREIIMSMRELVHRFHGERVGLVLWNALPLTVFPPTDDYDLVTSELDHLADLMSGVYVADGQVWGRASLISYLKPTVTEGSQASSLIGDGLATCTQAFPRTQAHPGAQRSRSLVFATDNLQLGSGIYTLPQAADLVAKGDITLMTIYSTLSDDLEPPVDPDAARAELAAQTRRVGGKFYIAADPGLNDSLMNTITSTLSHRSDTPAPPIHHDDDADAVRVLAVAFLVALAIGRGLRR